MWQWAFGQSIATCNYSLSAIHQQVAGEHSPPQEGSLIKHLTNTTINTRANTYTNTNIDTNANSNTNTSCQPQIQI